MKRVVIAVLAGVFMAGMMSCKTLNTKRMACDKGCKTAKEECCKKAKDAKGNVNQNKKMVCDAAAKKCIDECGKKYGN